MSSAPRSVSALERLEDRVFLSVAPQIVKTVSDNRGKVLFNVNEGLDPATVTTQSVVLFTAGPSGNVANSDHVRQTAVVRFKAATNQIVLKANLPAGTAYEAIAKGKFITSVDGTHLDGEFNGAALPSGNGTPGGNYKIETSAAAKVIAVFTTSEGTINVKMTPVQTPLTVANFASYANAGSWDNTFFHRSVPNFVIQGGGFEVSPADQISKVVDRSPVKNEPGISNTRGTIAMAKLGSGPDPVNSATNEWFFNLADNSSNLDNQNGGFTVFGSITNGAGLAVMDAIGALPRANLNNGGAFTNVPIRDVAAFRARNNTFDPNLDVVFVKRIAFKMAIGPIAPTASAVSPATAVPAPAAPQNLFSSSPIGSGPSAAIDVLDPAGGSSILK